MGERPRRDTEAVCSEEESKSVGTPVTMARVLDLLESQQFRCALSGRELNPQNAALDHVVPIRCGGQHVIENTQVLHKHVNRAKGSLARAEFIDMCHEVVRWSRIPGTGGEEES